MRVGLRDVVIEGAVLALVILTVAFLGPFGSSAIGPLPARVVYWGGVILAGYVLMRPVIAFAPALARRLALPELVVWIGCTLVVSLPFTYVVWAVTNPRDPVPTPAEMLAFYPNVALLGVLINLVFWAMRRPPAAVAAAEAAAAVSARVATPEARHADAPRMNGPRLKARLPAHLGGAVIAVEMEDHYARVHTAAGSALLLMRMRDAVAELDGLDGAQVHRSWWVARGAVEGTEADGRNVRLRLAGGLVAPVARTQVAVLREAGWPV